MITMDTCSLFSMVRAVLSGPVYVTGSTKCRFKMNLKVHVKQGGALERCGVWTVPDRFYQDLIIGVLSSQIDFSHHWKKSISAFSPVWFSKCWTRWKDYSAQSNSEAQALGRVIHHWRLELHISCRSWPADQKYRDRGRRWYYKSSRWAIIRLPVAVWLV